MSRDALTGPGETELDFAATRNTRLAECLALQFRVELFNILSHSNFLTPNEVIYSSASADISPTACLIYRDLDHFAADLVWSQVTFLDQT